MVQLASNPDPVSEIFQTVAKISSFLHENILFFEIGSCYIAQAGLEHVTLPTRPPKH
jgi:hypothetical protein